MLSHFLFDSTFANGAYSHSFGLESYISCGVVKDPNTYQTWLTSYMLNVFAPSDGAAYIMATKLRNKPLSFLKLARAANSSITSFEVRQASINIARATMGNTTFMHSPFAKWYYALCENDNFAHPALAYSVLVDGKIQEYAYSCIKTLTGNATRAIPLSYKKSSEILYTNIPLVKQVAEKSLKIAEQSLQNGYFSLTTTLTHESEYANLAFASHQELDISMYAHENLNFRLFMS